MKSPGKNGFDADLLVKLMHGVFARYKASQLQTWSKIPRRILGSIHTSIHNKPMPQAIVDIDADGSPDDVM